MPASISEKQATAATIQVMAGSGERVLGMTHYRYACAPTANPRLDSTHDAMP
ncbi:hypothetical protein XHV734_4322 [Xanthomonas hortorum pv. vitians]|nr:hypothetical protein XHV734_4322 [Xanthomonas hortorum pv. vitians]